MVVEFFGENTLYKYMKVYQDPDGDEITCMY